MENFSIIYPSDVLAFYIKHYWILEIESHTSISERIIPTGYVNLVFHKADRMYSSSQKSLQPQSFICGQNSDYADLSAKGKVYMIVVVFQPHGANAFFNIPIDKFYGQCISVNDIESKHLSELEDRIQNTDNNNQCINLIEKYLIRKLYSLENYQYKRIISTIQQINTQTQINITNLADKACLSTKQFNRIFMQYVGTSPKEFSRIIRFQRSLYTLQTKPEISLTELSYHCGYYDQSHLIRDFKSFSGYNPSEYLSVCAPYSDYFS